MRAVNGIGSCCVRSYMCNVHIHLFVRLSRILECGAIPLQRVYVWLSLLVALALW